MNAIGFVVLAALIGDFSLRLLSEALNLKAAGAEIPEAFRDTYDPQRYRRTRDYLRARTRLGWASAAFFLALTLAFWFGGGFRVLDDWVRALGVGPVPSGLLYIGTIMLARALLAVPFQAWAVFVIEARFGFNRTRLRTFLADGLKALVLSLLLGGPLLAGVLALFEYAGPFAWVYCWVLAALFMLGAQFIAPRWIMPLFNTFAPLAEGELRTAIFAYARSIRFPLENVFVMDGSRRSTKSNAFFTGFGKHRRIALFDTLTQSHPIPGLIAVLAHETGHFPCLAFPVKLLPFASTLGAILSGYEPFPENVLLAMSAPGNSQIIPSFPFSEIKFPPFSPPMVALRAEFVTYTPIWRLRRSLP